MGVDDKVTFVDLVWGTGLRTTTSTGYDLYVPLTTTATPSTFALKTLPFKSKLTGPALKIWVDNFLRKEGYVPR